MRQSCDYTSEGRLSPDVFHEMIRKAVQNLDVERAREDVLSFLLNRQSVEIWSADFFSSLIEKVEIV